MNTKFVVEMLRKKTHHFLTISILIMVISLTMLNFTVSYISNQYQMINKDFMNNNNVKVIHVTGKGNGEATTQISLQDVNEINTLLKDKELDDKAKAYPVYTLPTVYRDSMATAYSMIGISEELAPLVSEGCTLKDGRICVGDVKDGQITLNVPIIEEKDGGFSSTETVDLEMTAEKGATNENAIFIHSIPKNNQAYVNEKEAKKLTKIMYEKSQNSSEYIQESQLSNLVVYVKDIKNVDTVGKVLKDNHYFTSYTFNSFENFSINISTNQMILIILCGFLVITSIVTAILLMINFLRIQKKEIAILKLIGYKSKMIVTIYTRLLTILFRNIFLYTLVIYLFNYFLKLIPVSLPFLGIIVLLDFMILLITLAYVYFFGIKKICRMDTIELLKKGKEFE
ncbi:ABC transporter permease [Bacillus sp. BHET2]|uniref:ABC transporter permease n=1 Tax=Bacillus sp. BHET2 TaxID=2583818 RepID=UPI00110DE2E4|nr:ABC transporter permease [Bacillus sp. BHET2]TMU87109.1 ABC transporter permease [Bacillus sp. BHET2]